MIVYILPFSNVLAFFHVIVFDLPVPTAVIVHCSSATVAFGLFVRIYAVTVMSVDKYLEFIKLTDVVVPYELP